MQLEDRTESTQRSIEVLEEAEVRDLEQIYLEEAQATDDQRAELKASPTANQNRIAELAGVPAGQ